MSALSEAVKAYLAHGDVLVCDVLSIKPGLAIV